MVFENSFAKISDYIRHNRKQINVLVPQVSMWKYNNKFDRNYFSSFENEIYANP